MGGIGRRRARDDGATRLRDLAMSGFGDVSWGLRAVATEASVPPRGARHAVRHDDLRAVVDGQLRVERLHESVRVHHDAAPGP